MKLAVFGEIYSPNLGDGVIFDCLDHALRAQGLATVPADLSLRTAWPEPAAAVDGDDAPPTGIARAGLRRSLTLRRAATALKWWQGGRAAFTGRYAPAIEAADGVVIGGGQLLVERQYGFPLKIAAILAMARAASKPVAVFSCGADAGMGPLAQRIYRNLLRDSICTIVRDRRSAAVLREIGGDIPVRTAPDAGFLAGEVYPAAIAPSGRRRLGINVMPRETVAAFAPGVGPRRAYDEFWKELVRTAGAAGWEVVLLSNGDPQDHRAAREIHAGLEGVAQLAPRPAAPGELAQLLASVDALVTSRMHAGILAWSLGKAVLPLVWDSKVRGVWQEAAPEVSLAGFADVLARPASELLPVLERAVRDGSQTGRSPVSARVHAAAAALAAAFRAATVGTKGR